MDLFLLQLRIKKKYNYEFELLEVLGFLSEELCSTRNKLSQ